MSFEDDFVLPPRSTGRPPNRNDTTSHSSSVSSSVENRSTGGGGAGRSGGERLRKPPAASGNPFLEQRILPIVAYADELRRDGSEKLSEDERLRLFGSRIVPIPVPLEPKESEATHEKRFRGWLAKRRIDLETTTAASERKLRTEFARFKVRIYSNGSLWSSVTSGGNKRGRAQYERGQEDEEDEEEDYDDNEIEEEEYDDQEEDHNYRAVYAEEDEYSAGHDDEDHEDDLARLKRRRTDASLPSADLLLRKRVVAVDQYRWELEHEQVRKLTSAEKVELYGTTIVPVPVPLFPGETVDNYEKAFLLYLLRRGINSARFATNPNGERSQRIKFARFRATDSVPSSMDGADSVTHVDESAKPSILARVGEPSAEPVAIKSEPKIKPSEPLSQRSPHPMDTDHATVTKQIPAACSLVVPPKGSTSATQLRAFLACGCRECVVQCVNRLVDRVEAEERAAEAKSQLSKPNPAMDSTRDEDTINQSATKGVDVAKMIQLTSLMKNRRQRQATSKSFKTTTREDPIELQLVGQYDEINARVRENQFALERIAAQLQATPIGDINASTPLQREMQDLEGLIEDEMDHRNAALAMLAVFLWHHDNNDLTQRLQSAGDGDVPHVQRVCHEKCATLAADVAHKKAQAAALKQELDAVLMGDGDAEDDRLTKLQRVGEQLTRVEHAVTEHHASRRRQVATLIHFDAHVRELVETLMLET